MLETSEIKNAYDLLHLRGLGTINDMLAYCEDSLMETMLIKQCHFEITEYYKNRESIMINIYGSVDIENYKKALLENANNKLNLFFANCRETFKSYKNMIETLDFIQSCPQ